GVALSTRTRYSTSHVPVAVFGPSIETGFDKAADDPDAPPVQASTASRSVPPTGTMDAFTDTTPNDPFAYQPLPDALPYGVLTVRENCTCQTSTTRRGGTMGIEEDADESAPV